MKRLYNVDVEERLIRHTAFGPGCWEWQSVRNERGYGRIRLAGRFSPAHRVAHLLYIGPIPDGMQVDHLCKNPGCVRPDHLEAVTQAENLRRSDGRCALNARKTHCVAGHEFTPENTYNPPKRPTRRHCRACMN